MAVDTDYALAGANGIASVAPTGTAAPTNTAALSAPWVDLGALSTDGLTESNGETRTSFKRWGSIIPFKTVVTDQTFTFKVKFLESNANVLGLYYKTAAPTPTGTGTSEVQSVTVNGSPTGGTFVLVYGDVATTDIAYNATAATVQSALQALSTIGSGNVTVTGSAGGPYTVTFAGALANQNVAQLNVTSNLTGGTSPSVTVATTTPGTSGQLITVDADTTGKIDLRAFVFDVIEGTNVVRYYLPQAEITNRDDVVHKPDGISERGVEITAYPDATGLAKRLIGRLDAIAG